MLFIIFLKYRTLYQDLIPNQQPPVVEFLVVAVGNKPVKINIK